ncbi:MAG: LytR C-terminal domain-containing protein [Leptospirales bacterium]|jgi:hypothetical protein
MSALTRVLLGLAGLLVCMATYLGYQRLSSNDLELKLSQAAPFGVRFAILDDRNENQLEALAQTIIWPGEKRALLYFMNTHARHEIDDEAIRKLSPRSADRFAEFTEISNDYYITINRSQAVRLLDVLEGITLIVEDNQEFPDARFQYPRGVRFYPGEQILEYALSERTLEKDPSRFYLNTIEKLYRTESTILNLYWRLGQFRETLEHRDMRAFAAGLVDSNLSGEELASLFDFLNLENEVHLNVLEVPMEIVKNPKPRQQDLLLVNPKRGRIVFREFNDDLRAGRLTSDLFPIDVLNGTEVGGLARRVKQFLQDRGLQVLDADNYPHKPLPKSFIVSRSGDTFITTRLMQITALERTRVVFGRSVLDVDASFIIGADFDTKQLRL